MQSTYTRTKLACYMVSVSISVTGNISPLLFLTFRSMYGISYSLLGLLVLVNFSTQLIIDLIFSFFSHKFNIEKAVKLTPVLSFIGMLLFALAPFLFAGNVYLGLLFGTVIFSAAGGFAEVLISPVIAAIPSENPDREMSKFHSVYAWGVVFVIIFSTMFILLFGSKNWQPLILVLNLVALFAAILFSKAEIPQMKTPEKVSGALAFLKRKNLWLCVVGIFLGGAAECTMAQWASGYLEQALSVPKVWGDIFGVALFAVMLGLGRTLYSKIGKNIARVLLFGAIGAAFCYLTAALTSNPVLGLLSCAFTGFCTSMLWPGSLIVASEKIPDGGVFIYAMMAAGGDLGASVAPQLIGIVTDFAIKSQNISRYAQSLGLLPEQLGMKLGMLIGMLFPLLAIPLYFSFKRGKSSY